LTVNLSYTDDVRQALDARRPVVALESTIIAHGMPYPQNVETARAVEASCARPVRCPPPLPS
jgi:pseudouridylate synthase